MDEERGIGWYLELTNKLFENLEELFPLGTTGLSIQLSAQNKTEAQNKLHENDSPVMALRNGSQKKRIILISSTAK